LRWKGDVVIVAFGGDPTEAEMVELIDPRRVHRKKVAIGSACASSCPRAIGARLQRPSPRSREQLALATPDLIVAVGETARVFTSGFGEVEVRVAITIDRRARSRRPACCAARPRSDRTGAAGFPRRSPLRFELIDAYAGVNTIAIHYRSVARKYVIEIIEFDEQWRAIRVARVTALTPETRGIAELRPCARSERISAGIHP
jgi:hypothetical protein